MLIDILGIQKMNLNKVCGKFNPLWEKAGNKMFNMELKNFRNSTNNSYNF